MGDGVEEEQPDEEDGGLLVLLLDIHGYVHDTHSSHIYLSKKIILVQLGVQQIHKYSVAEPEPMLRIRIRSDPDLFAGAVPLGAAPALNPAVPGSKTRSWSRSKNRAAPHH